MVESRPWSQHTGRGAWASRITVITRTAHALSSLTRLQLSTPQACLAGVTNQCPHSGVTPPDHSLTQNWRLQQYPATVRQGCVAISQHQAGNDWWVMHPLPYTLNFWWVTINTLKKKCSPQTGNCVQIHHKNSKKRSNTNTDTKKMTSYLFGEAIIRIRWHSSGDMEDGFHGRGSIIRSC